MAYTKTVWKDRNIQRPNTFQLQNNPDGTITLIPKPGTVTEIGTPVNAVNLNKIEDAIYLLDGNKVDKVSGKGLSTNDYTAADKGEVAKVKDKADKTYVDNSIASIIESGSNSKGSYTKFSDGTMTAEIEVFLGDVNFNNQAVAGVFTGTYTEFYDFPIAFSDVPKAIPGVRSTGFMYIMLPSITKTQVRVRMWAPYSSTQNGVNVTILAKGRWK